MTNKNFRNVPIICKLLRCCYRIVWINCLQSDSNIYNWFLGVAQSTLFIVVIHLYGVLQLPPHRLELLLQFSSKSLVLRLLLNQRFLVGSVGL